MQLYFMDTVNLVCAYIVNMAAVNKQGSYSSLAHSNETQ